MKFAATMTRNRIASTLRWMGLAALENQELNEPTLAETLGRFERVVRQSTYNKRTRKGTPR
jgi:hypothetical protein